MLGAPTGHGLERGIYVLAGELAPERLDRISDGPIWGLCQFGGVIPARSEPHNGGSRHSAILAVHRYNPGTLCRPFAGYLIDARRDGSQLERQRFSLAVDEPLGC